MPGPLSQSGLVASRLVGVLALAAWALLAWLSWPARAPVRPPATALVPAPSVQEPRPAETRLPRHRPEHRKVAVATSAREVRRATCSATGAGPPAARAARTEDLRRWVSAMQSTTDDRVRAAGWFIDLERESTSSRDQLATLAATSSDPVLQALAQRACRNATPESSACQALAPDAWARLEPDNAAAQLAEAADPRLDEAAQLDALQAAARATRFDSHLLELHALAESARPADAGDADRLAMASEVVRARADWLATEALRAHCSGTALATPSRQATCAAIADRLPVQAQTLADLQEARELGERLHWPGARLDGLRDTTAALQAVERAITRLDDEDDCAQLASAGNFYADVGRRGEIGALGPAPGGAASEAAGTARLE